MRRAPAPALESGRTACDVGQATHAVRSQGDVFFDAEKRGVCTSEPNSQSVGHYRKES